ncbi:MAG: pyridoxamine 5'-phosphate oxidase family protein [Thiocapsa sp.]|jgi:hypothetical protein|nr:pyridoxamine 5'-phosphate oxidase family protein [Thiocapsa sp.]MCG6983618.1 pyridoxamine 5'-phosphate oxidase family protein [Thiocapsa sp.]
MRSEPTAPGSDDADANDRDRLREKLLEFRSSFASLLMATVNRDGSPEASYAPFVEEGGDFYIYVSELSIHTRNLMDTGRASVLFIEEETASRNTFARRRLTVQCVAREVARGTPGFDTALSRFESRFGALIKTLRGLPDFHLFQLRPGGARYVTGFGKAFEIDRLDLAGARHLKGADLSGER